MLNSFSQESGRDVFSFAFVCAPASITKNKKEAKLPLRPEVVEALRSIRPSDDSPFQWVFHGLVPRVKTLQKDLSKAGIAFVEGGRRLDFHALRATFCTMLAVNNVPLTDAMHLMRHSEHVPALAVKGTEFFFAFDEIQNVRVSVFSPGGEYLVEQARAGSWDVQSDDFARFRKELASTRTVRLFVRSDG